MCPTCACLGRPRIFGERSARFRALAPGHAAGDWLFALAGLCDAQHEAAMSSQPALAVIVARMLGAAWPARAKSALARLAAVDAGEAAGWAAAMRGEEGELPEPAAAPFVGAALQVEHTLQAERVDMAEVQRSRADCPVCAMPAVAGVVQGDDRVRYLTCSLCATAWHRTRVECATCGAPGKVSYFTIESSERERREGRSLRRVRHVHQALLPRGAPGRRPDRRRRGDLGARSLDGRGGLRARRNELVPRALSVERAGARLPGNPRRPLWYDLLVPSKCVWAALSAVIALLCLGCSDDVRLLGTWTRVAPDPAPVAVTLPGEVRQGATIDDARATIETVATLPPEWRGKPVTLAIPEFEGDVTLYVNGRLARMPGGLAVGEGAAIDPHGDTAMVAGTPPASPLALTQAGSLLGTPVYMAPELAEGARDATPAADMWAFGVMAYQLMTGVVPFTVPPVLDVIARRAWRAPAALDEERHGAGVATLVERCLSAVPQERPTADECVAGLA